MRCFNHPDLDAVGVCKVCQKGLCPACGADLGHSLACKATHEEQAARLHALVQRNLTIQRAAGGARYAGPVFMAFMGAAMTMLATQMPRTSNTAFDVIGVGFLVYAAVMFTAQRRAFATAKRE